MVSGMWLVSGVVFGGIVFFQYDVNISTCSIISMSIQQAKIALYLRSRYYSRKRVVSQGRARLSGLLESNFFSMARYIGSLGKCYLQFPLFQRDFLLRLHEVPIWGYHTLLQNKDSLHESSDSTC